MCLKSKVNSRQTYFESHSLAVVRMGTLNLWYNFCVFEADLLQLNVRSDLDFMENNYVVARFPFGIRLKM